MPDDTIDEDERWIDPTTWPNAAAHPEAVDTLTAAFARILTPYAREHGSARSFATLAVESMAVAGRLLPEGGETTVETEVVWLKDGRERDTHTYEDLTDEYWTSELAAARKYGVDLGPRRRREVRQWPDGTTLVGPWVAVNQEATDAT